MGDTSKWIVSQVPVDLPSPKLVDGPKWVSRVSVDVRRDGLRWGLIVWGSTRQIPSGLHQSPSAVPQEPTLVDGFFDQWPPHG